MAAQAGGLNVTGQQIASEMDLDINDIAFVINGEFNEAAFAGEEDGRTGLQDIDVTMEVDADADEGIIETWLSASKHAVPSPTLSQTRARLRSRSNVSNPSRRTR